MWQRKSTGSQSGKEMATRIFRPSTITWRGTRALNPLGMDTLTGRKIYRTSGDPILPRMPQDETSRSGTANQNDAAVMSRRSFVKSAAAAAVLGATSPQALMAETKEEMPQRALGRTGEKVSAIGLGGYHIGKQADEAESITIIIESKAVTPIECLHYALNLPTSTMITGIDSLKILDQALEAAK